MFQDESWKPIYFGGQKVKGQGHELQKHCRRECLRQWPVKYIYFSHASAANSLTLLDQGVGNGRSL